MWLFFQSPLLIVREPVFEKKKEFGVQHFVMRRKWKAMVVSEAMIN